MRPSILKNLFVLPLT